MAIMHQIRFRLGLRHRPAEGAHSALPDPLTGFEEVLLLTEGKGNGREGNGRGRGRKGLSRYPVSRLVIVEHV